MDARSYQLTNPKVPTEWWLFPTMISILLGNITYVAASLNMMQAAYYNLYLTLIGPIALDSARKKNKSRKIEKDH